MKRQDRGSKTHTYPKENEQKLRDTLKKLRAERRNLLKRITFLEDELINVQKIRARKKPELKRTAAEWRKEFTRKFTESLKNREVVSE